jgi:hypothetical protein
MMLQLLIPRVQNAEEADFRPEQPWIASELHQRFRAETEQQL